MRISTEIGTLSRFVGAQRATALVGEAGFDAYDLSLFGLVRYDYATRTLSPGAGPLGGEDYLAHVRELRGIAESYGMVCNQSHAPFPSHIAGMEKYLKRAVEATAEAGAEFCVLHPDGNTREEMLALVRGLLPFARACGVRLALENIAYRDRQTDCYIPHYCSGPAAFAATLDELHDDFAVACLDIAHAELRGLGTHAVEMIRALGPRLRVLHVHDNDCWHDLHQLPLTGEIDFPAVMAALREIGYDGYLTLECDGFIKQVAPTDPVRAVREMALAARRLAEMLADEGASR